MKGFQKLALMAAATASLIPSHGHAFFKEHKHFLNTDKISISPKPNRKRGKYKPNQFKKRKGK